MRYEPGQLTALFDEVVKQGGALMPDPCERKTSTYDPATYPNISRSRPVKVMTQGCGHKTVFVMTYREPLPDQAEVERGVGIARACAHCDNMGLWPRYVKAVFSAEPYDDEGA